MRYPKISTGTLLAAFLAVFLQLHKNAGSKSAVGVEEGIASGSPPTRFQFHAGVWNQAAFNTSGIKSNANGNLGQNQDNGFGEFDGNTPQVRSGSTNNKNGISSDSNNSSSNNSNRSKDVHDAGAGNADSAIDPDHNPGEGQNRPAGKSAVLPGQPVSPFTVDTPMGPFYYDPATSELPVVVMVFNPQDPLQRAMWSAGSLQMFLRHAPLAAADYLFVPYTYSPSAAADVAYYMYREMIVAAREVYGSDETTDEELRKRVLPHLHFSTTPATAISPQILLLLDQWTQDMKTLHARTPSSPPPPSALSAQEAVARSAAATATTAVDDKPGVTATSFGAPAASAAAAAEEEEPEADGLTVGRLDAWYGWLPSPATVSPNPAPLVAFDDLGGGAAAVTMRSPCNPLNIIATNSSDNGADGGSGGGSGGSGRGNSGGSDRDVSGGDSDRLSGAWVLVSNTTRESHPGCTYGNIITNMQRVGALGVIFSASPGNEVEVIKPTEVDFQQDGLYGATTAYGKYNRQRQDQHLPAPLRRCRAAASTSIVGGSHDAAGVTLPMGRTSGGSGTAAAEGEENMDEQPCIPATMVSYSDGMDLMTLLGDAARANVTTEVEFRVKQIPTGWFVIDPWAGLAEAGWAQLPVMMHAGWGAWWHVYLGRLRQQLQELKPQSAHSHVVAVFNNKPFPGPHGATVTVVVPHRPHRYFKRLLLNFALGCSGPTDASCPAWDHMVQLFVCCAPWPEHCRPCPTTLWKQPPLRLPQTANTSTTSTNTTAAANAREAAAVTPPPPQPSQRCGLELGRWATPFRRRVGWWLTDVTSLMGLLGNGGRCSFTVQTAPWADGNWTATLSLILARQSPSVWEQESAEATQPRVQPWGLKIPKGLKWAEQERSDHLERVEDDGKLHHNRRRHGLAVQKLPGVKEPLQDIYAFPAAITAKLLSETPLHRGLRPFGILPLFDSATFDGFYNSGRSEAAFSTPSRTRAATIVSYITGHGSTTDTGCCEFFPTSHHLYINGLEVAVLNFTEAGTSWGCADAVLYGGVPNQHGTWIYGRGGWCDGAAVQPWVVDISRVLRPPGSVGNNTIRYKGLYGDQREPIDPPEGSPAGYIMMQSVLVLYE